MLILDFDGVLVDSLDEVVITAYNAAYNTLESEINDQIYLSRFKEFRHIVQPAGDFLPFALACKSEDVPAAFRLLQNKSTLKERTDKFFETREKLIGAIGDKWLALHRPFSPIFDALKKYPDTLILTNKNISAVINVTKYFGLNLNPENIYSGDNGRSKIDNFQDIFGRFPGKKFVFVDDSLLNLLELRAKFPEVEYYLALWGYISNDDPALAASSNIKTLSQEDAVCLLKELGT